MWLQARSRLVLEPLAELCSVRHCDVRARQLECAARLLHSRGDQLGAAWPLMMEIIAAISDHHRYHSMYSYMCIYYTDNKCLLYYNLLLTLTSTTQMECVANRVS